VSIGNRNSAQSPNSLSRPISAADLEDSGLDLDPYKSAPEELKLETFDRHTPLKVQEMLDGIQDRFLVTKTH